MHKPLIDHGAVPEVKTKPQDANIAFAGPGWWLRAHGFKPGPWKLASDPHVMALPKGENGWMLVTVQRHLNSLSALDEREAKK